MDENPRIGIPDLRILFNKVKRIDDRELTVQVFRALSKALADHHWRVMKKAEQRL